MKQLEAFTFAPRARRDLRGMDGQHQRRVLEALGKLAGGAQNADVKTLVGKPPHLRLRVGQVRVLFRELTREETRGAAGEPRWLVVRVVQRGELERATAGL